MSIAVDEAILERFTGQTQVRDPALAQASVEACRHRFSVASRQLRRARREALYREVRLLPIRLRAEPWVIALVLSSVVAFSASLLAFFLLSLAQGLVLALMPVIFAAVGAAVLWLLWDRDGETPETRDQVRRSLLAAARSRVGRLYEEARKHAEAAEEATLLLDGIRQAIAFPVNRLLNAQAT